MSVLIKGMEMPKSCKECQVTFGFGDDVYCPFLLEPCDVVEDGMMFKECPKEGRLADCPLVEIKEPHGRLGDLDELKSKFRHSDGDNDADSAWISMIRRVITQAKTIIEAEGK